MRDLDWTRGRGQGKSALKGRVRSSPPSVGHNDGSSNFEPHAKDLLRGFPLNSRRRLATEAIRAAAQYRRIFPYGGFESLDTAELQILLAVSVSSGTTPASLAEELSFERSSVSSPLSTLESSGLVELAEHPDDGRRKLAHTTPRGEALVGRFLDSISGSLDG